MDRMINNAKFIIITEFLCIAYKSQCHMIRSRNNGLADGLHESQKKRERLQKPENLGRIFRRISRGEAKTYMPKIHRRDGT